MFWKKTREDYIKERVSRIVCELTDGDYTDKEISDFITSLKNRSLEYLKTRAEMLDNKKTENIEAIKKLSHE